MKPFKVLNSKRIINEKYCCIDQERVEFPDGSQGDWFIKQNHNAVIIIPELSDGQVLLEKTYKHGCGEIILEFPAGLIDPGEDPETAAQRELLEETGYQAQTLIPLGEAYSSPTGSPMKHIYFLGKNCELVSETDLEPAEQIELVLVENIKSAQKKLTNSKFPTSNTALTALALYPHQ